MEITGTEKVIRAEIYQPFACYREPLVMSGLITSLPLPPPTTIAGMLGHAMDNKLEEWIDIAVIGKADSFMVDFQRLIKDVEKYHHTGIHEPSPASFQVLINVNLKVFIKANNNEEILDTLKNPKNYLTLGRKEDSAFVKKAELVEIKNIRISIGDAIRNNVVLENTYVPYRDDSDIGYYYRLSRKYKSLNKRDFEFGDYIYVSDKSKFIAGEFCMCESNGEKELFRWLVKS